jgi:hypothetical protein
MSDTVQKARALLKEVQTERGYENLPVSINRQIHINEALCRAIEQHEATKQEYSDFQQKVSNAVKQADLLDLHGTEGAYKKLHRFIIPAPKPDPLVEALVEIDGEFGPNWGWEEQAKALRQLTQSDVLKAAAAAIHGLLDITSEYNLDSEQASRALAALREIGTALQDQSK